MSSRPGTTPPTGNDWPAGDRESSHSSSVDLPAAPRQSQSNNSLQGASSASPRRGALVAFKNLFTASNKEKDNARRLAALVSNDGSIRRGIWEGISKNNSVEKRTETVNQVREKKAPIQRVVDFPMVEGHHQPQTSVSFLSRVLQLTSPQVVRNRSLQISTLEGLYHDTKDMLMDPDTKEPVLKLIIEMTNTQRQQLGLALRHTFFEQIRTMGCEPLTLKWLNALSEEGRNVSGFEKDMDNLIADWLRSTLNEQDHPEAMLVLQLTQVFIKHNSAFISHSSISDIVRCVCVRACRTMEPLTKDCLEVLDCVLKYSDLPRDQLMSVVSVICIQVCNTTFRVQAWTLARALLTSQLGHRTRKHLQLLLEQSSQLTSEVAEEKVIRMLRGAVFCLANANWGISLIDTVKCSPANIIPSMEKAMSADKEVCSDVLLALRRLIQKHGRDLQQMTWLKLIRLFETAIELCRQRKEYEVSCEKPVQELLLLTEELYRDGHFSASADQLFNLIEKCADRRPDSSVLALIEYRAGNISPLSPDWIQSMLHLIKVYSDEKQVPERRVKVFSVLHSVYTKYRMLYEHELITQLMLPVLQEAANEKNSAIQYQMLNVLFDVAKTVSLRGEQESLLFNSVISLVRQLLNQNINRVNPVTQEGEIELEEVFKSTTEGDLVGSAVITNDNLLIMALGIDEILAERWKQLNGKTLGTLLGILVEHIEIQYAAGSFGDHGSEVRAAVMNALLSIHCCPITNRIQRLGREDVEPQANMFVKRRLDEGGDGFTWSDICRTVTKVITYDKSWPVIRECLERLGRVLEHVQLVRTASVEEVDNLTQSLVGLYRRGENGGLEDTNHQLAKYLPPVLATLLNYTCSQENKNKEVCRVLVDCVHHEHMEALMACDVAVQLVPSPMGAMALVLIEHLIRLPPTAKRAIPLIEFMSDSAEIPELHKFFQEKHFRMVVDILTPYADVRQFNTYIVACIHRILMRWYAQIPEGDTMRHTIRGYIEQKVRDTPLLFLTDGMHRQHSGDGRQVPGHLFLLGGDPSTPPPMDGMVNYREERGPDIIFDEVQRAMSAFFRLGRMEDETSPIPQAPPGLVETSNEHYFVNDCIISIRTLTEKREEDNDDVFPMSGEASSPPSYSGENGFSDFRRRHQSAIQDRRAVSKALESMHTKPKALDDLYAAGGPHHQQRRATITKVPVLSYTQLIVRHMYGRSSWMMRSFEEWPDDFARTAAIPPNTSSLLFHLINTSNGVVRLGKKGADEALQRAIRNIDRVPGIEMHAVGVLYIGPHQTTEVDVLSNTYGSDRYARFIKLLGDPISLEKCPGGLELDKHGQYTYEYRDELSRIVFLIATLMPNQPSDPHCNSKKKLIANNFVSIVFNESGQPYRLGSVCGQFVHVALEVVPCDTNSVLLTVHAKQEISCWLAMKRVLLSDSSASRLLRKLAVRAQLSVNVFRSVQDDPNLPYISLGVDRLRKIHAMRDKMATTAGGQ